MSRQRQKVVLRSMHARYDMFAAATAEKSHAAATRCRHIRHHILRRRGGDRSVVARARARAVPSAAPPYRQRRQPYAARKHAFEKLFQRRRSHRALRQRYNFITLLAASTSSSITPRTTNRRVTAPPRCSGAQRAISFTTSSSPFTPMAARRRARRYDMISGGTLHTIYGMPAREIVACSLRDIVGDGMRGETRRQAAQQRARRNWRCYKIWRRQAALHSRLAGGVYKRCCVAAGAATLCAGDAGTPEWPRSARVYDILRAPTKRLNAMRSKIISFHCHHYQLHYTRDIAHYRILILILSLFVTNTYSFYYAN